MSSRNWITPTFGAALLLSVTVDWTAGAAAYAGEPAVASETPVAYDAPATSSATAAPGMTGDAANTSGGNTSGANMGGANTLSGTQEVPPVSTQATATSMLAIGDDGTVAGTVDTTGIEGTAAHIHQGATGANGPVVITLTKTSATQWSVPKGAKLTPSQLKSYKAGDLYVNVHSAAHKNGEIRQQLKE
jgi:hypothetical protein